MSKSTSSPADPRSIRQKRVLELAEENPDASLESLASAVPSASVDLVEQVLDEYGDPAITPADRSPESGEEQPTSESSSPGLGSLSTKQRETLRAIYEHPEATQGSLTDVLGVSASTISQRVNSIDGFEWEDRKEFAEAIFESEPQSLINENSHMSSEKTEIETGTDQITERITRLEQRFNEISNTIEAEEAKVPFHDPDLLHKVIHACVDSDVITEDEELRILKGLLE